jgi:hypothetical protein
MPNGKKKKGHKMLRISVKRDYVRTVTRASKLRPTVLEKGGAWAYSFLFKLKSK